jgi:hypothetical protein
VEDSWFIPRSTQTLYHVTYECLTPLREVQFQKRCQGHGGAVVVAASQENCFWKESVNWCITGVSVLTFSGLFVMAYSPSPKAVPEQASFKQVSCCQKVLYVINFYL